MCDDCFNMSKLDSIVIYGAGRIGELFCNNLLKQGYHVKGFIDIMEKEWKLKVPVFHMDTISISSDDIVIISLQNGLLHESIAETLYRAGYRKIVYLPMNAIAAGGLTSKMFHNYSQLYMDDIPILSFPYYEKMFQYYAGTNTILWESHNLVVVSAPIKLVYSCMQRIPSKRHPFAVYYRQDVLPDSSSFKYDCNIAMNTMYYNLFRYLDNQNEKVSEGALNEYLENNTPQQYDKEQYAFFEDRRKLFELFEKKYGEGMDFFISSAPPAMFNKKGYLNLLDGHHRCCYLAYKGMKRIPILLTREDYNQFTLFCDINSDNMQ